MERQIQKKYFIGETAPGKWASVYTYRPMNPDIRKSKGEIFAAVSLQAPPDFASPTAGNLLIDYLHENYFEDSKDKVLIALEKCLINTRDYLLKLLENDKAAETGIDLDITAMVIMEDVAYLAVLGDGHIHIFRDGNITDLVNALRDPTGEGLVHSGSIVLKRADVITLSTPITTDEVDLDELVECSVNFSDISLRGKGHEKEPNLGLIMVGYNVDRKESLQEYSLQQKIAELQGKDIPGPAVQVPEEIPAAGETVMESAEENPEEAYAGKGTEPEEDLSAGPEFAASAETAADAADAAETVAATAGSAAAAGIAGAQAHKDLAGEIAAGLGSVSRVAGNSGGDYLTESHAQEDDTLAEDLAEEASLDAGAAGGLPGDGSEPLPQPERARGKDFIGNVRSKTGSIFQGITSKIADIRKKKQEKAFINQSLREANDQVAGSRQAAAAGNNAPGDLPKEMNQPTYIVILQRIKGSLAGIFARVKNLVWNDWLGMGKNNIYLRGGKVKRNWLFIAILIIVVGGILYFSIKATIQRNEQLARENEARIILDEAGKKIDEVAATASLVVKSSGSFERRQAMLADLAGAENQLAQAKDIAKYQQEIADKQTKINELKDILNKTIAVTEPKLVADIGGLYPGADLTDMAVSKGTIFITDKKYGKVYQMSYSGNDLRDLATGFSNPYSITIDADGNPVVIDEDSDQRLATVGRTDGVIKRYVGTSSTRLGGIGQIEFADISGGRIYGVDKNSKSVVALQKTGNTYGIPQKRVDFPDADKVADISINDFKIYLLGNFAQGINRTLNGVADTPQITGLAADDSLLGSTAFNIDGANLYIADPAHKRVAVFPKEVQTLDLKAQYVYRGSDPNVFTNIKEVYADRDAGKLFVLDGSKIYELDLTRLADF